MSRRRSYRKAQRRESKSGEHSSSASKCAPKVPSESGAQTLSESADEWAQFHRSTDEAATTSRKAKSLGKKGGGSSEGQGGPMAKSGSGKGSKRTGKEAGLTEKPRWHLAYKIPKRPVPDTSVNSEAPTPRKSDKNK